MTVRRTPIVAIIGTAGRDKRIDMNLATWRAMVADVKTRVHARSIAISGGAAWADHLAVYLYLNGLRGLRLRLPAPFKHQFEGGYGTAGGAANYYHQRFSAKIGEDTLGQIAEAIRLGAQVTHEPVVQGYSAMMRRNTKVAQECTEMIAYTYGKGDIPADGGTLDTWNKCTAPLKVHVCVADLPSPR